MWSSFAVLLIAAVLTAAAAFWVLRAYRRGGAAAVSPHRALAACAAVALVGLGIYLAIGRPELPGAPYAARLDALRERPRSTYGAEEWLAVLRDDARLNPHDPGPHFYQGEILLRLDRPAEAARAFDSALRREPRLGEAMIGLGRAVVRMEGGLTPEALTLFEQASALTDDPAPWLYQAWAAMETGRDADARRFWGEAVQRMAPDDPRRAMAPEFSAQAGR